MKIVLVALLLLLVVPTLHQTQRLDSEELPLAASGSGQEVKILDEAPRELKQQENNKVDNSDYPREQDYFDKDEALYGAKWTLAGTTDQKIVSPWWPWPWPKWVCIQFRVKTPCDSSFAGLWIWIQAPGWAWLWVNGQYVPGSGGSAWPGRWVWIPASMLNCQGNTIRIYFWMWHPWWWYRYSVYSKIDWVREKAAAQAELIQTVFPQKTPNDLANAPKAVELKRRILPSEFQNLNDWSDLQQANSVLTWPFYRFVCLTWYVKIICPRLGLWVRVHGAGVAWVYVYNPQTNSYQYVSGSYGDAWPARWVFIPGNYLTCGWNKIRIYIWIRWPWYKVQFWRPWPWCKYWCNNNQWFNEKTCNCERRIISAADQYVAP